MGPPLRPSLLAAIIFAIAAAARASSSSDILQEMREFREVRSVLYVAAHPDDENSRLIAYFARGQALRTAYLSLTRGDGGQNLIGPELGDELGLIRTEELLGARRIDGARQFFSRARDFGFSKDYRQTLRVWDERKILADVVRVIRTFRPDVIITRFPPWPSHTHGQHTASAYLALEAFRLSGDPTAFPEQLGALKPWAARRILWNSTPYRRRGAVPGPIPPGTLRLDAGGYQPILGEWFGVIAARSRSMQKTQGMGTVGLRGSWDETFQLLAGEPARSGLFDGVDPSWSRFPGGAGIGQRADALISEYNPASPVASVPILLDLRRRLDGLESDPVVAEKKALLDRLLQDCLGLHVETTLPDAGRVPGEGLALTHLAIVGSDVPVRWLGVVYPGEAQPSGHPIDLKPNQPALRRAEKTLPPGTPLSEPFWLRKGGTKGTFDVPDSPEAIRPENFPIFPMKEAFSVGGESLEIADEPVEVIGEPARGEVRRPLEVISPVWVDFAAEVELFPPGATKEIRVGVTSDRPNLRGRLRLEAPSGWKVAPSSQSFQLDLPGERASFAFRVTAPSAPSTAELGASAEVNGESYRNRRVVIRYPHIPEILYQPPARLKAVSLDLAVRARRIGYLPGAGDRVPEALEAMGCAVTRLRTDDLAAGRLGRFDAIVFGVRCFNVHPDLTPRLPAVWDYVRGGGTLVVQYNTNNGLKSGPLAPLPLEISDGRVTDENAPVSFLAPDQPALNTPNRIGPGDFAGWVQERARYLPSSWDPGFVPLLSSGDPGEEPDKGLLLVARYGRGYYVYSGLSWFHELPAGVPGAYRLFANLVSLGK